MKSRGDGRAYGVSRHGHRGGGAARRCPGFHAPVLRGKGLITSIGRHGLRRRSDPSVLERLALIALGRASGFSLAEISRMFAPDGRLRVDRQMLAAKADELGETIDKLTAMRNGLQHAVACQAPSYMECPTFRRFLQAAASGAIGDRKAAGCPQATQAEAAARGSELAWACAPLIRASISTSAPGAREH